MKVLGKKSLFILILTLAVSTLFSACSLKTEDKDSDIKTYSSYLRFVDREPELLDPQCISENYTVPLNVFDRLVEDEEVNGKNELVPSLAESWEISEDGLEYTFHLRRDVTFSNGQSLTSDDVAFTFDRLLTNPASRNQDVIMSIMGAEALRDGRINHLSGFEKIDDYNFRITLGYPYSAFLESLTTPAASILDKESTLKAGEDFGKSVENYIGTGPFILSEWKKGKEIVMAANKDCWSGAPACEGLEMMFYSDNAPLLSMFIDGNVDILDLDNLGLDAEYFLRGDIYRKNVVRGQRVGISYIALNESVKPLNDVRVRKALQLALDRRTLLQSSISGRGILTNGIFPKGLRGYNPDLPEIPFDTAKARKLLKEAGYKDGFSITIACSDTSTQNEKDMLRVAASMWEEIGVHSEIVEMSNKKFLEQRRAGELPVYAGTWSADFNDPDNFIYTFFGTKKNSFSRSLCYSDEITIRRVQEARAIVNQEERMKEYQELEKKIIQDNAAWIPLYSKIHFFAVSDRVSGFNVRWNGWSSNRYDHVSVSKQR